MTPPPSVDAPERDPPATDPTLYREHCRLPGSVLSRAGTDVGRQVRLCRGSDCVLATVVDTAERAVVSPRIAELLGGVGRLRVAPEAPTPQTSLVAGQFVERVRRGGRVVAVAPHGGHIEPQTDAQARRMGARGATAWTCSGWWPGGRAFDRWHVTSGDLHPRSFPALDALLDSGSGKRGAFEAAVSFHGWRHEGVGVGGGASRTVRQRVVEAIERVTPEDEPVRRIDEGEYVGDAPENIVNWLTADGSSGVQIEQSTGVRWRYGSAVADAVANVLL